MQKETLCSIVILARLSAARASDSKSADDAFSFRVSLKSFSIARLLTSFYTVLAVACITLVWVIRYVGGSDVTGGRVGLLFHYVPPISEIRGS